MGVTKFVGRVNYVVGKKLSSSQQNVCFYNPVLKRDRSDREGKKQTDDEEGKEEERRKKEEEEEEEPAGRLGAI
jgi:hypothetical protein